MQISDHPYIIGEINVPIKKKINIKKVNIIDKTIALRNKERLNQLFIDKDSDGDLIMEEQMENPNRCITIKDKTFITESNELIENYNEIKKEWRERFLLKREKEFKNLNRIMDSKINTEEAYLKINSNLNNKNKVKFYTPENGEEINNILIGFKELYHNNENKINIKGIELINKMSQTI